MAIKIFIDPGHNPRGFNTGAEGNGFAEQEITLSVGKLLYSYFAANSEFQAKLSRADPDTLIGTDNNSSLRERVRMANAFGADLFLSLHANASSNPTVSGSEALIYRKTSTVAAAVAKNILDEMNLITGLRNRGIVERPGLYVLRKTVMPAVLVEMGFISNPYDAELMAYSPNLFALSIYRGVMKYYGVKG